MNIIRITDINQKELEIYSSLSEPQLLHYNEPAAGIFIAESPNVILRAISAGYEPISFLSDEKSLKEVEKCINNINNNSDNNTCNNNSNNNSNNSSNNSNNKNCINTANDILNTTPVFLADDSVVTQITGFHLTRGILCAMKRTTPVYYKNLIADAKRIVVLEGVVNPTNLGAIFRNCAALGADCILLSKSCTDPLYRRAARVSMGTVFKIPWTYLSDNDLQEFLNTKDFTSIALALSKDSVEISNPLLKEGQKTAIFLGNEGYGLSADTIKACDYTAIIPMAEGVDSLNVAAASAVALWELFTSPSCHL